MEIIRTVCRLLKGRYYGIGEDFAKVVELVDSCCCKFCAFSRFAGGEVRLSTVVQ